MIASRRVVFGGTPSTGPLREGPGWLEFESGRISRMGEGDAAEEAEDLGGLLLAPAFINPHTHLSLVALRGFDLTAAKGNVVEDLFYRFESKMCAEDVAVFARMGAYESLMCGVGLVWDHYFFGEALAHAIADVGLCAVVAPTVQDLSGPGVPQWERALEETQAIARSTELLSQGVVAACGPHATDTVSETAWREVLRVSAANGLPVHAHLAQSPEEVERALSAHGCTPAQWLQTMGVLEQASCVFAHALYVTRAELAWMRDAHTLVACPYSQLIFGFPARLDVWSEESARWTLATDAAASNDSMALRKELRFAAAHRTMGASWSAEYERFLQGQGSAAEVWSTRVDHHARFAENADPKSLLERVWGLAGALHPAITAGVFEVGALANVVAYDPGHPSFWPGDDAFAALAFADVDGAIDALWVAGEPIGERGDVAGSIRRSEAYQSTKAEARSRLTRLLDTM